MKSVSEKFKNEIKQYGRQIDTIITYNDGEEHLLDTDVLFSVTPTVNGNILKSVMKQLDFESSVKVPKGTIINVKFGVQVDLSLTVAEVNEMKASRLNEIPVNLLSAGLRGFEYINLGNYIVSEEPEYNADTLSYSHVCYDKMLYSMKDYEKLAITYPITVREYINKICEHLGLTFKNINDAFANYDKQIKLDLYDGYDYTFRDILDELAQVTASTICINESTDELEIRYLNDTQDTIDEDYLKDVNVEFGEKYGPINSIVLSRSGESDNVFLQDEQSIQTNGLCELKIIDNQIMNDNDRSDFLPDILSKLDGLEYFINDFSSTGITWYELCDKYTVQIGTNQYGCVLFNDEIKITQGLEETIYTEMPETSETDYSKADKTDRKINKAYIIVDKQNQKIEALISQQTEQSSKLTQVEQTIGSISQKVENIEDVTNTVEGTRIITLENCVEGDLLELHIYGNNTVFDFLRLSEDLILTEDLTLGGDSEIIVIDEKNNSTTYDLGVAEVLRQNGEIYDEYILKEGNASVIRRINTDGSVKLTEEIEDLGTFTITLKEGTNTITIKNYTARIMTKWVVKNEFTDIYATRVEMNSKIEQTAGQIKSEVDKKVDETEFGTMIEQNWEYIKYAWNQISQYLKMEGLEGKATLNIYDENNTLLMSLSQDGQTFYNSEGNKIGTVGIVREENQDTLAFAMNVDWDKVSESKSMAWGYFSKSGKFLPIFRLVGTYGGENSEYGGDLAVEGGLQVEALKVIKNTIESGDTSINICDANGNIIFSADSSTLFFNILNLISSYRDKSGSICFDFGDNRLVNMRNVAQTDENLNYIAGSADNHIFASFKDGGSVIIFASSSDRNLKKNIEDTTEKGLDKIMKIKHRKFDWKSDNSHQNIGYIAQEMQEIDDGFVHHTTHKLPNGEEKEDWQINNLGVLAVATKAIQEQQSLIEEMQEKNKQRDEIINNLISKIERLEEKVNGV